MNRGFALLMMGLGASIVSPVMAGPFDPPLPVASVSPAQSADVPQIPGILDKLTFVGKINNIEVYYHDQTRCYIHVKDGVIEHDACYVAVNHWLLNSTAEQPASLAGKAGNTVHR